MSKPNSELPQAISNSYGDQENVRYIFIPPPPAPLLPLALPDASC